MIKKFYQILLLLAITSSMIAGCSMNPLITGSDTMTEEEMAFSDFNAVELSHSFSAEIIQSDQYKVVITYNSNLKEYLEAEKEGKTLKIGLDDDHQYRNIKLSVKIYMPDVNGIAASGACKLAIAQFNSTNLKIILSGASELNAKLNILNNLKIESSGASDITLAGLTKNAEISLSGASEIKGKGLIVSDNLNIECSGASTIILTADGKLSLELSGASELIYYGMGKIIKSNTTGASTVKKIEGETI